ncbi:MAG: hypothetical protein JXB47_16845 [Anaerolineae bacterium]|nr:hypothetical protein [Anaerolineae bacterium]
MVGIILQVLALWFLLSIPLGLIVGRLLARASETTEAQPVAFSNNGANPAQSPGD